MFVGGCTRFGWRVGVVVMQLGPQDGSSDGNTSLEGKMQLGWRMDTVCGNMDVREDAMDFEGLAGGWTQLCGWTHAFLTQGGHSLVEKWAYVFLLLVGTRGWRNFVGGLDGHTPKAWEGKNCCRLAGRWVVGHQWLGNGWFTNVAKGCNCLQDVR